MRTLTALALVLVMSACADRPERAAGTGALAPISAGQDPVVLRFPSEGGLVTAVRYPGLDSVVWRSSYRVPPLARVLAHDPEDGYLLAIDSTGQSVRVDLRLGSVDRPGDANDQGHATADGATVFVQRDNGVIARYTPAEQSWSVTRPTPPTLLLPLRDGSLAFAERRGTTLLLFRIRPPDSLVVDSLELADDVAPEHPVLGVTVGDRLFVGAGEHVYSVRTRDFVADVEMDVNDPVQALTTSPSGDRVFVLAGDREAVRVIDRFTGDIVARVKLPAAGSALRSDPLGRVLLVQGAADSVWLVDVGTSSLVGTLRSAWRSDLPAVLPDGAVALVQGDSITLASSLDRGVVRSMPAVASQLWYPMRWNGFRPRARGIDEPVRFRGSGENPRSVGAPSLGADSLDLGAPRTGATGDSSPRDSVRAGEPSSAGAASPSAGFTVQFAAVLSEEIAREAAAAVQVDGRTPRITSTVRDGRTVYRVVLGPFPTREEADRVGRASGRSYWVFEGAP